MKQYVVNTVRDRIQQLTIPTWLRVINYILLLNVVLWGVLLAGQVVYTLFYPLYVLLRLDEWYVDNVLLPKS